MGHVVSRCLFAAERIFLDAMDRSPIQQTFELGKSISKTGKGILNFVQLSR